MRVFIGLGSNLGDRVEYLRRALEALDNLESSTVVHVSHAFESEPWGVADQPAYANAVAVLDTHLRLDALLAACKEIESRLGRTEGPRFGPRPIDLDIVLAGDEEWTTEELTVPHPRAAERDFVITPLLQIAPDARWPDGSSVTREAVRVGRVTGRIGTIPGFEDRTPLDEPAAAGRAREPMTGEDWVTVAELASLGHREIRPDAGLLFKQMVLEQEGIPFAWDPFPPERSSNPYGIQVRFRLKVPASLFPRARAALDAAMDAPPEWEEM